MDSATTKREPDVIDVDEPDVLCTGMRNRIHTDRPHSPRHRKRPITIDLVGLDDSLIDKPRSHAPSRPLASMNHCTELQRVIQSDLEARTACLGNRPTKKRETNALIMATEAVRSHELKRGHEVIEISSDSEPEPEPCPIKRQKVEEQVESSYDPPQVPAPISKPEPESPHDPPSPSPSDLAPFDSDDDDECAEFLASLDISNEANWVPLPERNKAEDMTSLHRSENDLPRQPPLPRFSLPRKRLPTNHCHVPQNWHTKGLLGVMSKTYATEFPKPFHHARRQDRLLPRRAPSIYHERGYSKLELTAKYPHLTSGSINKIVQAHGSVVLCAGVVDGEEDSDDDEDDGDQRPPLPENKLGSLVVYRHDRIYVAQAHCRPRNTSRGSMIKYYSVHDVAFNPCNPRQFISSGNDLVVQTWEILDHDDIDNDEDRGLSPMRPIRLDSRPQDLVYNPDGSVLAISCSDGTIRLFAQDLFEDMADGQFSPKKFHAAPRGCGHATGSTLWGVGPSKHLLFTSSEPYDKDGFGGYHHAFDTHKGVQAVQFDANEAGDAATISPDGTILVLFTRGEDNTHPIRLYDVRRKRREASEMEELEKFRIRSAIDPKQDDWGGEVNEASFSPDGRLLAVARNDNALHIYDVRALSRGPLCRFEHNDSDNVGGGGFGIVAAKWIQGRERIGIVSGGNDGCVRVWEPALGKEEIQGAVLGRTDFDVGHFSIGDRQNGELPLVIGDAGGGMHTYDFTSPDGIQI